MSVNSQTREQHKQAKKEKLGQAKTESAQGGKRKRIRIRLIPLWLRLIILSLFIVVSVILGAIFGYSVIGNGEAKDVFQKSTWTYIRDLIEHK